MMKRIIEYTLTAFVIMSTGLSGLYAQVNFPDDTIVMVIDEGLQNEQKLDITNNLANDSIDYDYHIFYDEFQSTPEFSTQFCDCFACLENYPATGSCIDLEPGASWPFAVYIVADSLIGGKYFSVSFVNPKDPSDADTITVMTEVGDTLADPVDTGIQTELSEIEDFSVQISPNPACDNLHISYVSKDVAIRIYNITGELVIDKPSDNNEETDIDISHLQRGVYIVNVSNETGNVSKRVMVE